MLALRRQPSMKKTPSDLKLLNAIYNQYYEDFINHSTDNKLRESKIYVPIDCAKIADQLGVDADIVFGRLYYHLQNKYGYTQDDGTIVPFFTKNIGNDKHCVHFPYLSSVLAALRVENNRYTITTWIAIAALVISSIAIGISFGKTQPPKPQRYEPSSLSIKQQPVNEQPARVNKRLPAIQKPVVPWSFQKPTKNSFKSRVKLSKKQNRDIEKEYSKGKFVAKLRRLADAIENNKRFAIQIAGERIHVPAQATFTVEHEKSAKEEEIEFQIKWKN